MKVARLVWKIIAAVLALAAVVCCVIAFWDKIEAAFYCVKAKLCKSGLICGGECEDFADWNEDEVL